MGKKHVVLAVVLAACAAGAYFWLTDSWPGRRDAGVKNQEGGQANQSAKATPSAPPAQSAAVRPPAPSTETAAAPEQAPPPRADDGRPLFKERESLRVKLEELEK